MWGAGVRVWPHLAFISHGLSLLFYFEHLSGKVNGEKLPTTFPCCRLAYMSMTGLTPLGYNFWKRICENRRCWASFSAFPTLEYFSSLTVGGPEKLGLELLFKGWAELQGVPFSIQAEAWLLLISISQTSWEYHSHLLQLTLMGWVNRSSEEGLLCWQGHSTRHNDLGIMVFLASVHPSRMLSSSSLKCLQIFSSLREGAKEGWY